MRDPAAFLVQAKGWSDWILDHFEWMFNWSIFACLLLVVIVYFSPLGKVTIGGEGAKCLLSPWRWFAVTICTTVAAGILFWGTAEPIFYLSGPPAAGEGNPAVFAMSAMFLHWTLTPYGMYTFGGLLFALVYYNRRQPFALSSMLEPLFGTGVHNRIGALLDAVCLFALVAGMAAALGAGALALVGGTGLAATPLALGLIVLIIVAAFTVSAVSGLQRGIRVLSSINIVGFFVLALFVFLSGPTADALSLSGEGAVDYVVNFLPRNLGLDPGLGVDWRQDWTSFYWAVWFAWAPVSALFLGRIGVGYTVRQFIRVNLVYTSLFGAFWMVCFAAAALVTDADGALTLALQTDGAQAVTYALLETLPLADYTPFIFLILIFLSYVTAADSNITAMSALCVEGVTPDKPEAPLFVKLLWGGLIGALAWVLVAFAGLDGIRLISTLGGFPAMLLFVVAGLSLVRLVYDSFSGVDAGAKKS